MGLEGKVALVTGATSGIGRAVSLALGREGVELVITGRSEARLRELDRELREMGRRCCAAAGDVSDERDVKRVAAAGLERFGRVDILVNNAGVGLFGGLLDCTPEDFERLVAVNLRGVFLMCRAVVPQMIREKRGDIVMVSSLAGRNPVRDGAVYAMSKHGLAGLAESMMLELREHGIRVMTVCPGSVDTEFFERAGHDPPRREFILRPEEVARTVTAALALPRRASVSEVHLRPTNPAGDVRE